MATLDDLDAEVEEAQHGVMGLSLRSTPFGINASGYGAYTHFQCDLFLRRSSARPGVRKAGRSSAGVEHRRASDRGEAWEQSIIVYLNETGARIEDCTTRKGPEVLLGILADAHLAGPVYLYQACFDLPVSCLPESLQRVGVRLGRLKPDLLRLQRSSTDQPWTITIIDAKATNVMKPSHQAQVTFYAYFLPQCLSAAASGDAELQRLLSSRLVWSGEGGVWLCKKESCGAMLSEWLEPFSLGPWLQLLQEDLLHRLPASAFACDVEDVAWQLTPSCQGCPYLSDCRQRGKDHVSGLPGLSREDSRFLLLTTATAASSSPASGASHSPPSYRHASLATLRATYLAMPPHHPARGRMAVMLGGSPSPSSSSAPAAAPPLLETMLSGEARPKALPCGLFPSSPDDVAVALVLLQDDRWGLPYGWGLAVQVPSSAGQPPALLDGLSQLFGPCLQEAPSFTVLSCSGTAYPSSAEEEEKGLEAAEEGCASSLISLLSSLHHLLATQAASSRVQLYVWDADTRQSLASLVLRAAQQAEQQGQQTGPSACERLAYWLLDSCALYQLQHPPMPAADAQFRSAAELGRMTAPQIEAEGGLAPGTATTRGKKTEALGMAREQARVSNTRLMRGAPVVCELLPACRALLHLPHPGFSTAADVAAWAAWAGGDVMEAGELEAAWMGGGRAEQLLRGRLLAILAVKDRLREVVDPSLLYNDSQPLPALPASPPPRPALLQRLAFMKQADVIHRCQEARRRRAWAMAASSSANSQALIEVRYTGTSEWLSRRSGGGSGLSRRGARLFVFEQVSGPPLFADMEAVGGYAAGQWLLTSPSPGVALSFLDLLHLTEAWLTQPPGPMTLATIHEVREGEGPGQRRLLLLELSDPPTKPSDGQPPDERWRPIDLLKDAGEGGRFWMFERVVDRNAAKLLQALRDLPAASQAEVCSLLDRPYDWSSGGGCQPTTEPLGLAGLSHDELQKSVAAVNSVYNRLVLELGDVVDARLRSLRGQQRAGFDRLLSSRLTLVWGPPGTGKTHFAAKSILTLIEAVARQPTDGPSSPPPRQLRVLVTAFTHTAINNLLKRVHLLAGLATDIADRQDVSSWSEALRVVKLVNEGADEPGLGEVQVTAKEAEAMATPLVVVGATIWRLHKGLFGSSSSAAAHLARAFDLVVVDEASQMAVADGVLPVCCLRPGVGRLLVLGDSLQLAPITSLRFPRTPPGLPSLHGSLLDCLTRREGDNGPLDLQRVVRGQDPCPAALIKLRDNHRMNHQLSAFTARLYGQDYSPPTGSPNATAYWRVDTDRLAGVGPMASLIRPLLHAPPTAGRATPPVSDALPSLISIRLVPCHPDGQALSDDEVLLASAAGQDLVRMEAQFVASLVQALSHCSAANDADRAAAAVFACTPHRRQKAALREALASAAGQQGAPGRWAGAVDTVERLQGQERPLVILCLGVFGAGQVDKDRDFLFSTERLNVALSRAQQCCVLVHTDAVLAFSAQTCNDAAAAFSHLNAFVNDSAKAEYHVYVPLEHS